MGHVVMHVDLTDQPMTEARCVIEAASRCIQDRHDRAMILFPLPDRQLAADILAASIWVQIAGTITLMGEEMLDDNAQWIAAFTRSLETQASLEGSVGALADELGVSLEFACALLQSLIINFPDREGFHTLGEAWDEYWKRRHQPVPTLKYILEVQLERPMEGMVSIRRFLYREKSHDDNGFVEFRYLD